jgi:protein gp37
MASKSKIEWCDATWTPIRARRRDTGKVGVHCERVSPACKNCYAARHNMRALPVHGTGLDFTVVNREKVEIFVDEEMLMAPLRWRRPRKIFVCSQTDLFAEFVDDEQIAQVFAVMALAHWHTHQVLTKRADRMQTLLSSEDFWDLVGCMIAVIVDGEVDPLDRRRDDLRATAPEVGPDVPLPNVWLGVTAENQEWADKRIPLLLQTPAAKRFVSIEPMLGPVDLGAVLWNGSEPIMKNHADVLRGGLHHPLHGFIRQPINTLDQVIVGGESGPGARPMHPNWARSLRDQCQAAGVAFFFKQWGEWASGRELAPDHRVPHGSVTPKRCCWVYEDGTVASIGRGERPGALSTRVGKRNAGRLLDGREWSEFPEVPRG